jgi:hypothetical protein
LADEISILPNQTLILYNIKETLKLLPEDCSPLLVETIRFINPLKSLSELSVEFGTSYSEVLKAARHLVFWRQARIIYPISLKQVYVISNEFNPKRLQEISADFSKKFSNLPKLTFDKVKNIC